MSLPRNVWSEILVGWCPRELYGKIRKKWASISFNTGIIHKALLEEPFPPMPFFSIYWGPMCASGPRFSLISRPNHFHGHFILINHRIFNLYIPKFTPWPIPQTWSSFLDPTYCSHTFSNGVLNSSSPHLHCTRDHVVPFPSSILYTTEILL